MTTLRENFQEFQTRRVCLSNAFIGHKSDLNQGSAILFFFDFNFFDKSLNFKTYHLVEIDIYFTPTEDLDLGNRPQEISHFKT